MCAIGKAIWQAAIAAIHRITHLWRFVGRRGHVSYFECRVCGTRDFECAELGAWSPVDWAWIHGHHQVLPILVLLLICTCVPCARAELPPATEAYYRSLIPAGVLTKEELCRAKFYDKKTTHQSYQDFSSRSGLIGFYDTSANVSANRSEKFGNANREFPWVTGGMDKSPDGWDFKAYIPPADGGKITGRWERLSRINGTGPGGFLTQRDDYDSMVGEYPVGAKVVEVLSLKDATGQSSVFEVRIMRKVSRRGIFFIRENWEFRVYRAVRDYRDLVRLADQVGDRDYAQRLRAHYAGSFPTEVLRDGHKVEVFNSSAVVDNLPAVSAVTLRKIHGRPFRDVTDVPWIETINGAKGYAGRGGIFPTGYQGNHFHSKNCADCHATVMKAASDFDLFRDWYGRVRGMDGVFSIPPMAKESVSRQDLRSTGRRPEWNKEFVEGEPRK